MCRNMVSLRIIIFFSLVAVLQLQYALCGSKINCEAIKCAEGGDPLCAWDRTCYKTFGNPCQLLVANCNRDKRNYFRIKHKGECTVDDCPLCPCSFSCIDLYDPVCGCNSQECKTFSNECYMQQANCQSYDVYKLMGKGDCGPILIDPIPTYI